MICNACSHFKTVPESRLAEIVSTTNLPKEKVQGLLKIGPFDNRGQFWHLTTEATSSMGAAPNGELGIK
jgi:hypothetical protein